MLLDLWNYANRVKSIEMNNSIIGYLMRKDHAVCALTLTGTEKKDEE